MAEQPPEPLPELPLASPPLPEGAPPAPEPARPAVVALLADLFFAPHFAHVIRTQGGAPLLVDTADALVQAVDRHFPVLALVDLAAPGDWAAALRRLKLRPTTRALPVYAFGAHVDAPALRAARAAGVPPTRTHLLGLPIRPAFAEPPTLSRAALRSQLGMDPELPAVILMGGGDGVGPVQAIATAADKAFAAQRVKAQIVVICGRNEGLRSRLAARTWSNPAHILGFVENVPDWMHACDAIVTKAGPGTIAEACVCGLPILLSGFIPGQEEGNVTYVVGHGAGALEVNPEAIGRTLAHWFGKGSPERLRMAKRARALGRPHATADIVQSVMRLMDEWDK